MGDGRGTLSRWVVRAKLTSVLPRHFSGVERNRGLNDLIRARSRSCASSTTAFSIREMLAATVVVAIGLMFIGCGKSGHPPWESLSRRSAPACLSLPCRFVTFAAAAASRGTLRRGALGSTVRHHVAVTASSCWRSIHISDDVLAESTPSSLLSME